MINEQGEYTARDKRLAAISSQSKKLSGQVEGCLEYAMRIDKMITELERMKVAYIQEAKDVKTDHSFYVDEYFRRLEYLESRGQRFKTKQ